VLAQSKHTLQPTREHVAKGSTCTRRPPALSLSCSGAVSAAAHLISQTDSRPPCTWAAQGSKHALRDRLKSPEHFRSIKEKVDFKTQRLAERTSAYSSDFVRAAVEYRPEYVRIEGSTVSGDAPQWMQVPGVKVNKVSSVQLKHLLNTSADINRDAVDPRLLGVFQVRCAARCTHPALSYADSCDDTKQNCRSPLETPSPPIDRSQYPSSHPGGAELTQDGRPKGSHCRHATFLLTRL
jgi:hypothetical protein